MPHFPERPDFAAVPPVSSAVSDVAIQAIRLLHFWHWQAPSAEADDRLDIAAAGSVVRT